MNWGSAIIAGLVATIVMTILMYMGKAMGMRMDMPRILGLMFAQPEHRGSIYTIGMIVHLMIGVIFAIIYGLLFNLFGIPANWLWGAVFGLIHGIVIGLMLPIMPSIHPRMGGSNVLPRLGAFASNYGSMIPVAWIVLHIIFGAVIGWLYSASV